MSHRDTSSTIASMEGAAMTYEVRAANTGGFTFTLDATGKPRIDARAILFDSWSVDLGGFKERMRPNSVVLDSDLVALFDHDTSKVLGRTSAGTMEVRTDKAGVAFSAYPPETTWAADLRVSMERGDIKGCSYRMMVDEDVWYVENGQVCRDVIKARVSELTITSMPAYPETTAEARDHAAALAGEVTIPDNLEERAGRVLSTANESALKVALEAIDTATETIKAVIAQVDPAATIDDSEDTTPDAPVDETAARSQVSEDADGASESREASGGAPETKVSTFVSGFGFITTKGK